MRSTSMIIVSLGGETNKQLAGLCFRNATVVLKEYELDRLPDFTDEILVLLDLDANGWFQNNYHGEISAEVFGEELIQKGLPLNLKKVFLMISDIHPKFSLFSIAEKLAVTFRKAGLDIEVYIPASLNHNISVIIPTKNGDSDVLWQVYGIQGEENVAALLSMLPHELPSKFDEEFLDKILLDVEENFLPFYKEFKEKIEIFSGNTESFFKWMQLPPRSFRLKQKTTLEKYEEKDNEEMTLFSQSTPDKKRLPGNIRKEPDSALENSSSPAKKPTPPMSPTSPRMRSSSSSSSLFSGSHVDDLPSESPSVSSGSLTPRAQQLLDELLEEVKDKKEQLDRVKEVIDRRWIDQQQPRIKAGGQ